VLRCYWSSASMQGDPSSGRQLRCLTDSSWTTSSLTRSSRFGGNTCSGNFWRLVSAACPECLSRSSRTRCLSQAPRRQSRAPRLALASDADAVVEPDSSASPWASCLRSRGSADVGPSSSRPGGGLRTLMA